MSRAQTAQYTFSFVGWSKSQDATTADPDAETDVIADRTIYAAYSRTLRSYTYKFLNDNTTTVLLEKTDVYGAAVQLPSATPVSTIDSTMEFVGYTPAPPATVTGTFTCVATYKAAGVPAAPTATTADGAYGVEWNYSATGSTLTRKGLASGFSNPSPATSVSGTGSSPFDNIAPWKDIKVVNYVNGSFIEKGEDGFDMEANDTLVWIPEFYYTAYKDTANNKWLWAISPTPLEGYEKHPGSGRYVGRYHTGGSSAGVYSKSGVNPLVNTNQTNFRAYSKAKGTGWYMLDLASWSAIQMLYLVEFANFDSQTVLGKGWNTGSITTVGGTDEALYHTIKATGAHNQYRWIEDPFSNVYDWIDGFLGSTSKVYVGVSNSKFDGSTGKLVETELKLPSSGWISGYGYDESAAWAFIPDTAGGGETTYVRDRVVSSSSACPAYVGGFYDNASCGFFYVYAYYSAAYSSGSLGSRLLLSL